MPSSRHTALTLPSTCAHSMTRRRIPCTLSSRVIGPSSHSGSLGRVSTLGKIGPMALVFVHDKCQHYSESGHTSQPGCGPPPRPVRARDGPHHVRNTSPWEGSRMRTRHPAALVLLVAFSLVTGASAA